MLPLGGLILATEYKTHSSFLKKGTVHKNDNKVPPPKRNKSTDPTNTPLPPGALCSHPRGVQTVRVVTFWQELEPFSNECPRLLFWLARDVWTVRFVT